jgi:hypothetical protein
MKPPEKIFINQHTVVVLGELQGGTWSSMKIDGMLEYHLAPQWRDAVKDPPKEDGQYLVIDQENLCGTLFYFKGTGWVDEGYPVTHWMPLPLSPERSGE